MFEIRHISAKNLARVVMTICVAVHLLFGAVIIGIAGIIQSFLDALGDFQIATATILTVWFAGTLAVGIASYILGLFAGFVYNLTARWWGGIRVSLLPSGTQYPQKEPKTAPIRPVTAADVTTDTAPEPVKKRPEKSRQKSIDGKKDAPHEAASIPTSSKE